MKPATSRPPLALIANDKEWSSRSIESILAPSGYAVLRAYNGRQTLERARSASPDLIILDANLPDRSGLELCRSLRDFPEISPSTPILITSAGPIRRSQRLEALRAGAWDYLPLPLDAEELLLRLDVFMRAKVSADAVREDCLVDEVTGLYNWRGLVRRAYEIGSDAYRHSRALACLAFAPDLRPGTEERPEATEDVLWAAAGHLARVLKDSGRVSDAIGRIRQEEFVVIAPETDDDKALRLARRLTEAARAAQGDRDVESRLQLLVGYDAVSDFRAAGLQPTALLAGATAALRESQAEPAGMPIRRFQGNREECPPVDD